MPLTTGETFAGFRIVRLLGSGGMGGVYLAEHPRLPRRDALKVLPADELAWSRAAETDAYAAPVTTTRHTGFSAWIRAGVVVAVAAGIVVAAISVSPSAIADDDFDLFMFNCGHVQTATPQLCKDTWNMVRANKCRSVVVEYLDRRGVAFGDDRQMFNYATEIQRGDVPLDVC